MLAVRKLFHADTDMVKHIGAFRNSANVPETLDRKVLMSSYTEQNFPFSNPSLVMAYNQNCFLHLSRTQLGSVTY
jgi:hypothetical protein